MSTPTRHIQAPPAGRNTRRLVAGRGQFVGDIVLPNTLVVSFVRSNVAHGRLLSVDVSSAQTMPGVVAVFVGRDLAALGPLPVNPILPASPLPPYPVLAVDEVHAVGQPVAAVVAIDSQTAADAAEQVMLEVEEIAPVLKACGNTVFEQRWVDGDVDEAFEGAAHRITAQISHPRLAPCAMETRHILAHADQINGLITVWLSTQTPHRSRDHLAGILQIPADQLRIIAPDVGGAFGMKASLYPEEVLVAWAARQLGRAVRWTASRSEDFLSATHGRGGVSTGELAIDKDGRFLALRARMACPLGHWLPNSAGIPAWNAARILPGPYAVSAVDISTVAALSDTAPVGIYRGAGRPEAATLMERLVDKAAKQLQLCPFKIRRKNVLAPEQLPVRRATGAVLDSGRYGAVLEELYKQSNYQALLEQLDARRARGELVGIGLALYVEPCGQGWESARVTVHEDGRITAATGGSGQGQSRESVLARLVADVFEQPEATIHVLSGDTASCPAGIGALASRSTPIGASAMLQAARQAKSRVDLADADWPIVEEVRYEVPAEAWGNGCYLATVSLDPDTGQVKVERLEVVDDIGHILDPVLVHAQIHGAIAQGLGEALSERIVYDDDGQLLTGSLMDYALPRATDMPEIRITTMATQTDANLLGAKGVGEAGTIATPPAVLNAVHDALHAYSPPELTLPITAEQVWSVLNASNR
ncbi:MAG: xanthine dehydrogenase family protein molybdopterin-binding subunit [Burkholderiaceae bacterium]